jgi:hypothetical protein
MAIRRFSTAEPGVKSNKFWDQDTQQGAMVPIASVTLTANAGAINFASVPQDYQDLMIVAQLRDTTASTNPSYFNFMNNNGGSVYSATQLQGDGSSASSGRITNQGVMGIGLQTGASATTGVFSANVINIINYKSSANKTIIYRDAVDSNGAGATRISIGLFRDTNPIIQFSFNAAAVFVAGSTATLYGIKAGA